MKIICMDQDCVHNAEGECHLQAVGKAGDLTNPTCIYYRKRTK